MKNDGGIQVAVIFGGFDVDFPRMVPVRQHFVADKIENVREAVLKELTRDDIRSRFKEGQCIAVTVGSRGIASIDVVVKTTVDFLKEIGTKPFIIPAMGSHGGASPEGQKKVLASYGITEETMGAPIEADMEVVQLGTTKSGAPAYFSKVAYEADGIVVINRVKNHTSFRGPVESGLTKMVVIGLGKHKGATYVHYQGFDRFSQLIPEVGEVLLSKAKIACGLALVENGYHELMIVHAALPEQFIETDTRLLKVAYEAMPRILFDEFEVLIVDEIGKDISGAGMDPNVTGRFSEAHMIALQLKPRVQRIVVLDLTDESYGNAIGLGSADLTTSRVVAKIDRQATYANVITSTVLRGGAIPMYFDTDKESIAVALKTCKRVEPSEARVVRIKNTSDLDVIHVSETLLPKVKQDPRFEIIGEPQPMAFTEEGRLI
jgi:hypothetical protein